jgi:Ca-activated chloride channel family protein
MSFIWPWMLATLLLIPFLVGGYLRLLGRRQQALAELGPLGLVQDGSGRSPGGQRHIPALFFLSGLTLLLFGVSRPEVFVDLPRVEGTVILAFDVSNSMTADDLEPTRMEAAKAAARTFVENQPSTIQIGVVAFSNGGLVVQPPTDDQAAILDAIDRLSPQGATSLGQGIFSALNAIAGEAIPIDPAAVEAGSAALDIGEYSSAVILLLTDGENTASPDPLEIAQLAAEAGVRIYPIGIGSAEGTVLQIDGFNVLTQLNEPALQQIASLTNGSYYHAEDEETLRSIYQNVDLQLTTSGEKTEVTALLAGFGLLFFLVGGALSLLWMGRMPL